MWHVSISCPDPRVDRLLLAGEMLEGVGDPARGQWLQRGLLALHLRRRVSAAEADLVGPVTDIRDTTEAAERVARLRKACPVATKNEIDRFIAARGIG